MMKRDIVESTGSVRRTRKLSRGRCSIVMGTGNLCGMPVAGACPLSVCEHHALRLYDYLLEQFPQPEPPSPTMAQRELDRLNRARENMRDLTERRRTALERQSQVYYVRIGDYVKIGYTVDMRARMSGLRVNLDAVMATEPGGRRLEAQRHRQFAEERIDRRENFNPSPRLLAHVEQVKAEHGDPWITDFKSARNLPA